MRRALLVVALAGGCDRILGLSSVQPMRVPDGAGSADGAARTCMQPSFTDPFTSTMPCQSWGSLLTNNNWLTEGSGRLTITMTAMGYDGCLAKNAMPFDDQGYFMAVDQPMQTPGAFTSLGIRDMQGNTRISISENTGLVDFRIWLMPGAEMSLLAEKPIYNATAMKFWRLRADSTTHETVAEYSADAASWTEIGRTTMGYMTNIYLVISAGLVNGSSPSPSPDIAKLSHLNACP